MRRVLRVSVAAGVIPGLLMLCAGMYPGNPPASRLLDMGFPLKVVYQHDSGSNVTVMRIVIPAGMRTVSGNQRGLAYLAARTALEIPSASLVRDLLEKGARFSSRVDGDQAVLSLISLSEHFGEAAAILGGILSKPLVSAIRVNRIKETMGFREIVEREAPRALLRRTMVDHFLGSQGYGGGELGCESSRNNIRKKDVKRHLERFYNTEHMIVSVVSDLDADRVQSLLRGIFRSIPRKSLFSGETEPRDLCPCEQVSLQDYERELLQPMLAWGMKVPELNAESFSMTRVLARVLARGPGSLAWTLRDPMGLAYTVDCDVVHLRKGGVLLVYLYTGPGQIALARKKMETIFAGLINEGIPRKLWDSAVRSETVAWRSSLQSKAERGFWLASFASLGLGIDLVDGYSDRIRRLSKSDADAFMRKLLDVNTRRLMVLGAGDPVEE